MDWIQQWQSKLNKQNGVAPLVRTGGSRHTGLAALPHRNIQLMPIPPISKVQKPFYRFRLSSSLDSASYRDCSTAPTSC